MVIQPLIGNPCNGYINPYYWVDDHPLLYGNNGSLDPGTYELYDTLNLSFELDVVWVEILPFFLLFFEAIPNMSNEQNPGWLDYIRDYTTQLYRDYNKPL